MSRPALPSFSTDLAGRIDRLLPQTQCTRCGFDGCRPYAEAIALGEADIDRCPPGGPAVIRRLARLLGTSEKPPDATRGTHGPRTVALIEEAACIGCTLCIQACPTDAIAGAGKLMHTVIAVECTGCELCIAPCPVDCIRMVPAPWTALDFATGERDRAADTARRRLHARRERLVRLGREHAERMARKLDDKLASRELAVDPAADRRRAIVEAALARARAKLAAMDIE